MVKILETDQEAWHEWVNERPEVIQELCAKFPPDRLYMLKTSNHRVTIVSYSEDGTITVFVSGEFNEIVFEREVFGVKAEHLEECDLPDDADAVGVLLTEPDDVDIFVKGLRAKH